METRIAVLYGMENTFPPALVDRINAIAPAGIRAEHLRTGALRMDQPCPYALIVDRISHDIPFYRAYLKHAVLGGTQVINNPFWWSADDKFFNYALADRIGVAVPRTVLLPHFAHPPGTTSRSMRNLEFPLDWDAVFQYVGWPAFLKPFDGGGWRNVYKVRNPEEFFAAYHETGHLCMTLQEGIEFRHYLRCYVVGQQQVRIMLYDPREPFERRYVRDGREVPEELLARVERDCLTLCQALGYDLNTVEFAERDGIPYAIDFLNPAPDADSFSVGEENFEWIVQAMAELCIARVQKPAAAPGLRWTEFLRG